MSRQMPAVTYLGPQSQPNWHCSLRITVQRPTGSLKSRGAWLEAVGPDVARRAVEPDAERVPAPAKERPHVPAVSDEHVLRAATSAPFRRTVAIVSRPSATRSTTSSCSSQASTVESEASTPSRARQSTGGPPRSCPEADRGSPRPGEGRYGRIRERSPGCHAEPEQSRNLHADEASGWTLIRSPLLQAEEIGDPAGYRVVLLDRVGVPELERDPERLRRGDDVVGGDRPRSAGRSRRCSPSCNIREP